MLYYCVFSYINAYAMELKRRYKATANEWAEKAPLPPLLLVLVLPPGGGGGPPPGGGGPPPGPPPPIAGHSHK